MVIVCTQMMLLTSCSQSPIYKIKWFNTKTTKIVEIPEELLEPAVFPLPVLLTPKNCPIILEELKLELMSCDLKIGEIKKIQNDVLKDGDKK